ncbi:MAG: hypothetical protein HFJ24_04610 [Clostridia bacterium]|nr:hypothetical protein [Clostridia bacterium]
MKIREEKGITLVALIITIIVLVILAAVTINAAFNSGIIDTAVNGAVNYADAQKKEQITFDDLDKNIQDIVNKIEDYNIGGNNPEPTELKPNAPVYEGTGLIPVYHNGTNWVDLTENSTEDEWNSWYSYDTKNKKWANARTLDGSMWVWIPRYEYKIDSTARTIDVRFIQGTSTEATAGYTLHPAFLDGTANGFSNGEWDKDIAGFWVAKYPAGWQNGQGTSLGSVDMSNIAYQTSAKSGTYAGTITNGTTKMSYPVFKANNYAYNFISVGDAYTLAQDIKNASRYGLRNIDSHLQKNSEWGAVAYLAHSKYGLNGAEVTINDTNKSNSPAGIYAVTSPETVRNTSTTQNITGVYDMSGCVWERTATFLKGANETSYIAGMIDNPSTVASSKYVTIYEGTWDTCNKIGDAVKETSTSGSGLNSWNGDCSYFVATSGPVFIHGGDYHDGSIAGIFAFHYNAGSAGYNAGFRVVLVP